MSSFIQYTSLCVCEENLNVGIRQKTFSGLMSQRLTWFSNKSVGTLSNMLSTDAAKISQVGVHMREIIIINLVVVSWMYNYSKRYLVVKHMHSISACFFVLIKK